MWWWLDEQLNKKIILYGRAHEVLEFVLPGKKARDKDEGWDIPQMTAKAWKPKELKCKNIWIDSNHW